MIKSEKPNTSGFTLLEVLVALVITGMSVAVFFQVISSGLRLEFAAVNRTSQAVHMEQTFRNLMADDVRESGFDWQGEDDKGVWELSLEQVETEQTRAHTEHQLQAGSELYRYVFDYHSRDGRKWTLVRYVRYEPDFFDEDFKRRQF